jgi:hypothetical protein
MISLIGLGVALDGADKLKNNLNTGLAFLPSETVPNET